MDDMETGFRVCVLGQARIGSRIKMVSVSWTIQCLTPIR